VKPDDKMSKAMMKYFASQVNYGAEIHGCVPKKKLVLMKEQKNETCPMAVPAAPGHTYILFEVVTSGCMLTHHMVVVKTSTDEETKEDDKCVFHLGRSPTSDLVVN